METVSVRHSATATNGAGMASRVRGRGRGRAHFHEENVSSSPAMSSTSKVRSERNSYVHHDDRFNEDAVQSAQERQQDSQDRTTQSDLEKNGTSDKENSCSPRPQRSRRSNLDTGVMSRINSYLREGTNERSDAGANHSLDRKSKESSPSPDVSGRGSPNLRLHIPANTTSAAQFAAMIRKQLAAGERPRSMTDPTHSGTNSEDQKHQVKVAETTRDVDSSQAKSSGSHTTSTSLAKAKGRGRARGRARSRQADMDVAPAPGSSVISGSDQGVNNSENMDYDRFVDAEASSSVPKSDAISTHLMSEESQFSSQAASHSVEDTSKEPETRFYSEEDTVRESKMTPHNTGISAEEDKPDESGKHLSLKIEVGGTEAAGDVCSPGQVDDITQLLSPNHEYTLDWAAAMETPTPETSFDSPPDWRVREEDEY